ncbi:MAG: hypothetical protein R3B07_23445 [Polyangiaceae bacterium]
MMNLKRTSLGLAVLFVSAGVGVGCTDSGGSCEDTLTCGNGGSAGTAGNGGAAGAGGNSMGGSAGDAGSAGSGASGGAAGSGATGGTAGTAGAGGTGPVCDPTSAPGDDACVIDDQYAMFVSPNGDDTSGDGSQASPFASIAKGITAANTAGKRLYVCADGGSYDEQVSLDATNAGVQAWGSFKCSDWSYDNTLKATVAPSVEGYALSADSVTTDTRLEGFEFDAQSATSAGGNSIAAFVKDSTALTLVSVKLVAGDGMKGADGARADYSQPANTAIDGKNANMLAGGGSQSYAACPGGGTTVGAIGGAGDAATPAGGGDGTPALTSPDANGGKGGVGGLPLKACNAEGGGNAGNAGPAGSPGAGASILGTLSTIGWVAENGTDGQPGSVGQGGGGGRGGTTGGGGGGGAGGCGGAPGGAGQGGGASVALMLVASPITLTNVDLVAGNAGAGGKGSDGQAGLFGGKKGSGTGTGSGTSFGCDGGFGGDGGGGGGAGGGAGGVSVGILFSGTAPTVSGGSTTKGSAGAAGAGGTAGSGSVKASDGVAGVSEDTLDMS